MFSLSDKLKLKTWTGGETSSEFERQILKQETIESVSLPNQCKLNELNYSC